MNLETNTAHARHMLMTIARGLLATALLVWVMSLTARADDVNSADQPIDFPHARHAGKFKINCMY